MLLRTFAAALRLSLLNNPVRRSSYFWGKLGGSAFAGAVIMAACLVLSVVGLTLINRGLPTGPEFLRLTLFYALSGLYLLLFGLIGTVAALLTAASRWAIGTLPARTRVLAPHTVRSRAQPLPPP